MREIDADTSRASNPLAELTPRERDALRLIAAGKTNADIASELVFSEHTIKSYVSEILGKLQVDDRTQAAVLAWREGFAPDP
jgi:two-component system, NarL family, response regulator LiaR